MIKCFPALYHGAIGDGVADDAPAIQALINTVEAMPLEFGGAPAAEIYVGPGYTLRFGSGIVISKPIVLNIKSFINYTPTNGTAITIGTAPTWMQYGEYNFKGVINSSGLAATPNTINAAGATGLKINHLQFAKVSIDVVQGFAKHGVNLDGSGALFANQVITHNKIDLGQVVNCGIGVKALSLDAATSCVQGNKITIQNVYQCFYDIMLDDPTHWATCSNTILINAMDDSYPVMSGGQGLLHYCKYNHIEVGYTETSIYAAGNSGQNSIRVYNPASTGAKIWQKPGDTNNYYQVA